MAAHRLSPAPWSPQARRPRWRRRRAGGQAGGPRRAPLPAPPHSAPSPGLTPLPRFARRRRSFPSRAAPADPGGERLLAQAWPRQGRTAFRPPARHRVPRRLSQPASQPRTTSECRGRPALGAASPGSARGAESGARKPAHRRAQPPPPGPASLPPCLPPQPPSGGRASRLHRRPGWLRSGWQPRPSASRRPPDGEFRPPPSRRGQAAWGRRDAPPLPRAASQVVAGACGRLAG